MHFFARVDRIAMREYSIGPRHLAEVATQGKAAVFIGYSFRDNDINNILSQRDSWRLRPPLQWRRNLWASIDGAIGAPCCISTLHYVHFNHQQQGARQMTELEKLIMHRQEVEDKISSLDKEIKEGVGLIITFGSHLKTARNRADTMHTVEHFSNLKICRILILKN